MYQINCFLINVNDTDNGSVNIIITFVCNTGCPTTAAISPSTGQFSAGDVLTCDANGFPEPSYQWTDNSGEVVSSTSTVTLPEGPFNFTCTATGNLPGSCSSSQSVFGTAKSKYRKQHNIALRRRCLWLQDRLTMHVHHRGHCILLFRSTE